MSTASPPVAASEVAPCAGRRGLGWGMLALAIGYFLASARLTPVDWELYVTEKIHLQLQGLRPFLDVEWPYGVLPFLVYGLPMKWCGTALLWQRLISVATAVAILVQAHRLLRDMGIQRGRWTVLALITLVSTSQQFAHSHPLITLCTIVLWRLLAREGIWNAGPWSLAAGACVVALTNKPLFGGWGLAVLVPLAAWWLGRLCGTRACWLVLATAMGSMLSGLLIVGQPWWLADWYAPFSAGRTGAILTALQHPWLTMRIGYLSYVFHEGVTPAHIQRYLTGGFPLLVFDGIMFGSALALVLGRLCRKTAVFLVMTVVVAAQVFIMGDITLIGYAQEIFPLVFLLAVMVARDLEPAWMARGVRWMLGGVLLALATFFLSSLYFTSRDPVGTGAFRGIHMLRQQVVWEELGGRLGRRTSAMSLGDVGLLFPTYHQGIPNFGAISETFLLDDCFQRADVERRILEVLRKWRPEWVLVAEPSMRKARYQRSLQWLREHYEEVSFSVALPFNVHCYRLRSAS